jgi:hypothetical protein
MTQNNAGTRTENKHISESGTELNGDSGLRRFMDVDLFDFLGKIANKVIIHYPNDWNIDKDEFRRLAASDNPEDKRLVWHTCSTGTHLKTERDVFIKDSGPFQYMTDYHQNDPDMFGYAVEITGQRGDSVLGNVFEAGDYAEYAKRVRDTALPLDSITLAYSDDWGVNAGKTITVPRKEFDDDRHRLMCESGRVIGLRWHPADETQLDALLRDEQARRMSYHIGIQEEHLRKVAGRLAQVRGGAETPEPEKAPDDPVTAAKGVMGQNAVVTDAQKGRTYTGDILLVREEYAVQKISAGRGIIHNMNKISNPDERAALLNLPANGRRVSISYDGEMKASLKTSPREEERETGVTR